MANFDKWAKGAAGHLFKHFERGKDENGEYIKFGNRDIDTTRTHLNYNLAPDRGNQFAYLVKRCNEVYCLNRKDVNLLGSWVVTVPEDLPSNREDEFFSATYTALAEKYGEENVISAYVHKDESGRSHMHFAFIPIVWDKKKQTYKVSAKECVSRTELQRFHPWLEERLKDELGYEVHLLNGATKEGNLTVPQLKEQTMHAEWLEAKNDMAEAMLADQLAIIDQNKATIAHQEATIEDNAKRIQDWPAYETEAAEAWSLVDGIKKTVQAVLGAHGIFRNRKAEKSLYEAFERFKDNITASIAAMRGFENRQRLEEHQRRSRAVERSLEELMHDAEALKPRPRLGRPNKNRNDFEER